MPVSSRECRHPTIEIELLQKYARPIVAMRRAFLEQRFGLILGAGVSRAFRFDVPDWEQLLTKLAAAPQVNGSVVDMPDADPATRAEVLFRHFYAQAEAGISSADITDPAIVRRIVKGQWLNLIRDALYQNAPPESELSHQHPYLEEFLDVVVDTPMTITYNFDSYLEMMLASRGSTIDERGRPYETVFDGAVPFRSRTGVIYHPNGYLPKNVLEKASDTLVFSEEEFEDQLHASVAGRLASIAHHLSKNICLFLGLSLQDQTLRYLLRRNAINSPGQHHYMIDWVKPQEVASEEQRTALFEYRFNVYNVITLFLTSDEIAAVGRLLRCPYEDLRRLADEAGVDTKYVFYLSGIPGIGKTTALRHLASLSTYDEWFSEPHHLLALPHDQLGADDRARLDDWVVKQLRDKNEALLREQEGIFVVERGPLDPISFVSDEKVTGKAIWYAARFVPTMYDEVCKGSVLLLWGDTSIVSGRIVGRQPTPQKPEYLGELQERLRSRVYAGLGVANMRSTDWAVGTLVREIARKVHLDNYRATDLKAQLSSLGADAPVL